MITRVLLTASLLGCVAMSTANIASADDLVSRGEALFKANCRACHVMPSENKNAFGPSLHGVVGRHSGIAPGYRYSDAMRMAGVVWTESNLDKYLSNPQAFVESLTLSRHDFIRMTFTGFHDDADRQAVIAFLKAN